VAHRSPPTSTDTLSLHDALPISPREATRPGGLGTRFDWRLLEDIDIALPFMLSGGLDAGNVAEALRITRAPGVDVSSGIERSPRSEEHTSELQSRFDLVCRLLLE